MPHVQDNKITLTTRLPKKIYCRNKIGDIYITSIDFFMENSNYEEQYHHKQLVGLSGKF